MKSIHVLLPLALLAACNKHVDPYAFDGGGAAPLASAAASAAPSADPSASAAPAETASGDLAPLNSGAAAPVAAPKAHAAAPAAKRHSGVRAGQIGRVRQPDRHRDARQLRRRQSHLPPKRWASLAPESKTRPMVSSYEGGQANLF